MKINETAVHPHEEVFEVEKAMIESKPMFAQA
jgi:hypothetical protein